MLRKLPATFIAIISLTLAGCSSPESDAASHMSLEAPPATKPATPSPSRNDRGNLVKEMGQPAAYLDDAGEPTVKFRVDWIMSDPKCDYPGYPAPPKGRSRIAVHMTVETTKDLEASAFASTTTFDPFLWKYIDSSGETWGGQLTGSSGIVCETEEGTLPDSFGPSEKGSGVVVMEVPSLDGTLIYNSPGGFEYDLTKALIKQRATP